MEIMHDMTTYCAVINVCTKHYIIIMHDDIIYGIISLCTFEIAWSFAIGHENDTKHENDIIINYIYA